MTKVIKTDHQSIKMLDYSYWYDLSLPIMERLALRKEISTRFGGQLPYGYLFVTENHPVWVKDKGWVAVSDLTDADLLLDHAGNPYSLQHPGYDGNVRAEIYKTAHPNIGFVPHYGMVHGVDGYYIDLTTGEELDDEVLQSQADADPILNRLYEKDEDWEQTLRDELGVDADIDMAFSGFKQGDWVNPKQLLKSKDGKNLLATTTVYNLEVENTHTYFVGKEGIWVHNCGGEDAVIPQK